MAVSVDPAPVAGRLGERLAERDANVLDRVVRVDLEVPTGLNVEVDPPVAGDLIEHVLEEWQARIEVRLTRSVEIHGDRDLRLERVAEVFAVRIVLLPGSGAAKVNDPANGDNISLLPRRRTYRRSIRLP